MRRLRGAARSEMSAREVAFIADVMLGRLARWLRLAGLDTVYERDLDDRQLADLARRTGRVLLTRDHELARRRGVQAILVKSDWVSEQLKQVLPVLPTGAAPRSPRCPRCNGGLEPLGSSQAPSTVPAAVRESGTALRRCVVCGQVYWKGSHWAGISQVLAEDGSRPAEPISSPPDPLL